jgi:chromodomain-helicase-DNA-binding protein 7
VDKLLPKLKSDGHKVLIFSQMVKVLDILEEYLGLMRYRSERIDGSVPELGRQLAIDRFATDPDAFVFLLCTRAGGVGINLTAADTVIIYDSDWNPQNDLQAESRCHRIGQTAQVKVYRLVTRGTYELEMLDRASKKLGLDHALLDGGEVTRQTPMAAKEVEKLLRTGVYDLANDDDTEIESFCAADIDQILERRSKTLTHEEVATDSVFSKAKFDAEGDNLDLNSKEFWTQAMSSLQRQEDLPGRRCRQVKPNLKFTDSMHFPKKKKLPVQTNPKSLAVRLMHHGYTGDAMEKTLILYSISKEQLEPADKAILKKVLEVTEFPLINEAYETKFQPPLDEAFDRTSQLLRRVVLHYQLAQVLIYIQGPLSSWPMQHPGDDPVTDYALLYGVHKNGLRSQPKIFQNTGFETANIFTDKQILKKVNFLVNSFLPMASRITRFGKDLLEPNEWQDEHEDLFSRKSLSDDELVSLFQTLTFLGFPETESGEIDWEKIANLSKLKCLEVKAIREQGAELLQFARDEFTDSPLTDRLGQYGNRVWTTRFRLNYRDTQKVRTFVRQHGETAIGKVRRWDLAPDWWTSSFDWALMHAISDFGLLFVMTWIVDPARPFAEKVPEYLRDEFQRAADAEAENGRAQKPRYSGEFGFLLADKTRMARVLSVIQVVEQRSEREEPEDVVRPQDLTELPTMPMKVENQLTVLDLGTFKDSAGPYPLGYVCHKQYFSTENPTEKVWYEAVTELSDEGTLQFRIRELEDGAKEYVCHTSSGCWEKVIQDIQVARGKMGLQKRKFTTVSGPAMYGFSNPTVVACFRLMKSV